MIEINNLHKRFGPKIVLDGVDFKIPDGDRFCIIGKSGCGKSVMLKLIVGLLYPEQGNVMVDDNHIGKLSKQSLFNLRRQMGFVFQGAALFDSLNVFENTILGMYEHGNRDMQQLEKESIRVLSSVQLLPKKEDVGEVAFEKEWQILKNKKPSDLSGGMRKRVGVARALVGSPKYIFYDEPTTGLDPVTSQQIDDLLLELAQTLNITSVIITHDMFSVFRVAKTVMMLHDGKARYLGDVEGLKNSQDNVVSEFIERFTNY